MPMAATRQAETAARGAAVCAGRYPLSTVAIIGTGLLGCGIAKVVARSGYPVILHDSSTKTLASAEADVAEAALGSGASVRSEPDLARAVGVADLIIEAVIEDLSLKQRLFERMGASNPEAVLMSNSSVLPIGQIAARASRPERAVGAHWWNPPHLIPVVEVIRGPQTSEAAMERTCRFVRSLGKTAVRVERDVPGFVGNRLQHALWREALALASDAAHAPDAIDRVVALTLGQSLARRGPFAEMNRTGLVQVAREFARTLPLINSEPRPAGRLREKVSQGQLGAKSGQGFLTWAVGARERAAQKLREHVERRVQGTQEKEEPTSPPTLSSAETALASRLRIALWREALAIVEGGVCDAQTVDFMATNTIGLRLAAMGPIENADYVGLDLTLAIHEALLPSLNLDLDVPLRLVRAVQSGTPV
jgi:3-hydroxybutyryl-CoA dehydrogenase